MIVVMPAGLSSFGLATSSPAAAGTYKKGVMT